MLTNRHASSARLKTIATRVSAWFEANHRVLPWRQTYEPYAVWISEVMLQQTQVSTVLPYFVKFITRFPNVQVLSQATEEEVLLFWSGLGYYSRARNLLKAAAQIVDEHSGRIPSETQDLLSLPGIGRYTAGAIASIAFNRPEPVVDGNVTRVLSRAFAVEDSSVSRQGRAELWHIAGELVHRASPRNLNQGMMELGAVLCLAKNPLCQSCPIKRSCVAKLNKAQTQYPKNSPRAPVRREKEVLLFIEKQGRILLAKRRENIPYGNMWDLPRVQSVQRRLDDIARAFLNEHGMKVRIGKTVHVSEYGIMNSTVSASWRNASIERIPRKRNVYTEFKWVLPKNLEQYPKPAPVTRFLNWRFSSRSP